MYLDASASFTYSGKKDLDKDPIFIGKNFRDAIEVVPIVMFGSMISGILFFQSFWYKIQEKTS